MAMTSLYYHHTAFCLSLLLVLLVCSFDDSSNSNKSDRTRRKAIVPSVAAAAFQIVPSPGSVPVFWHHRRRHPTKTLSARLDASKSEPSSSSSSSSPSSLGQKSSSSGPPRKVGDRDNNSSTKPRASRRQPSASARSNNRNKQQQKKKEIPSSSGRRNGKQEPKQQLPARRDGQKSSNRRSPSASSPSSPSPPPSQSSSSSPSGALKLIEDAHDRLKRGETLTQRECDDILAACVAQDEWDSVLALLDIMRQLGLGQKQSTYRACLQACFEARNAMSSSEILKAMEMAGASPEPEDIGLTVTTMCRCEKREHDHRWWQTALDLVQESNNLPVAAYDGVLSCLSEEREWKRAVLLLRQMESSSHVTRPALSTYRLVIECCVMSKQPEQAVQVLQACVNHGLTPTVYAFELVIAAFSKKLQWRRALKLLDMMDDLQIPKTIVCYNSVLSALSRAREVVQAKDMLVKMRKSGIEPNVISYNTVLAAAASTSRWRDALSILDECHRAPGVEPDIYTYTNAIRACAKGGMTRRALTLFQVVKDKQLPLDTYCYTAAIEACAKAKMWKMALQLIEEMEEKGILPSQVTYSVTITACGNGGQWEKALELLELMRQKNMSINLITYNAAITALSKAAKQSSKSYHDPEDEHYQELWPKVMSILEQMQSDGIEPDGFSFSSAISCCGAEGRWEEALELLELMRKGGPRTRPNKVSYSAAISSCGKAGQVDHALRLFRQMRDEGISADRVAYNALFSALRVSKRSDAAYELWGEMVERRQQPSNSRAIATARADKSTSPDIITVTDAIAAMSSDSDGEEGRERVDGVFSEAVDLGIILRSDTLDSSSEVDLSGMSFPVARAACRYILRRIATTCKSGGDYHELTFITGVGKGHRRPPSDDDSGGDEADGTNLQQTSLREYVQEILLADFDPPIPSGVPVRAQGTVEVGKDKIKAWVERQR